MPDTKSFSPDDLSVLESIAIDVARSCGKVISGHSPDQRRAAATKSSPTDVVTELDRRSEQLAREILTSRRPADGIYGEEGSAITGSSPITWVIDPIDGTVNYLRGIGCYAVSVAAVVGDPAEPGQWQPLAGAVYNPETDEMFHAAHGLGAWLRDRRGQRQLQISTADFSKALVGTGFSYEAAVRAEQGRQLAALLPLIGDIRRCGSAALDLCMLAAGRLDLYFERCLNPWDMAAGWVIVTEAGGIVEGRFGGNPNYEMSIAGSAELVTQLRALING